MIKVNSKYYSVYKFMTKKIIYDIDFYLKKKQSLKRLLLLILVKCLFIFRL